MISRDELRRFAPRAREEYVAVLCSEDGAAVLGHFGILGSVDRLCGFLANVGHETGGFTIRREGMGYKSADRLKAVWPSRFVFEKKYRKEIAAHGAEVMEPYRQPFEGWVVSLCGNEPALAEVVYGGRMGNRSGTPDAYNYRGAWWLQNTGHDGIVGIGNKLGFNLEAQPELVENPNVMLRLACYEWAHSGCNELMDTGDFIGACATINVGGNTPNKRAAVVGMDDRNKWLALARTVWAGDPDVLDKPAAYALDLDLDGRDDNVPGQEHNWSEAEEAVA